MDEVDQKVILVGFGLVLIALLVTMVVYIALMHRQMGHLDGHIRVLGPKLTDKLSSTQRQLANAFAPVDEIANAIVHPQHRQPTSQNANRPGEYWTSLSQPVDRLGAPADLNRAPADRPSVPPPAGDAGDPANPLASPTSR